MASLDQSRRYLASLTKIKSYKKIMTQNIIVNSAKPGSRKMDGITMNWLSQSPDANPIQNVWSIMKAKLAGKPVYIFAKFGVLF